MLHLVPFWPVFAGFVLTFMELEYDGLPIQGRVHWVRFCWPSFCSRQLLCLSESIAVNNTLHLWMYVPFHAPLPHTHAKRKIIPARHLEMHAFNGCFFSYVFPPLISRLAMPPVRLKCVTVCFSAADGHIFFCKFAAFLYLILAYIPDLPTKTPLPDKSQVLSGMDSCVGV